MGEAWDDLESFRRLRVECADSVREILTACARDHPQHKHVIECRECYEKTIDRMRARYSDPKVTEKWFSVTAEPTLKELDELFTAAKEYKADLADIDRRAEEERKRSYAHQVKASPSIRKSLEELLDGKELFASIGVKDATFEQVVAEVREALRGSGVLNGGASTETALQRLMEAKTSEERLQAYKQAFFLDKTEEAASEKTQMYLDRLQEGATMDDIVNKIAVDRRSSIGAMDRKEMHKKRIEDLRRARAAHELQKSRKANDRHQSHERIAPEELYSQPPCKVCGSKLGEEYVACPVCQVLWDAGIQSQGTAWCSAECSFAENGLDAHVEASHSCAGGDNCVQLTDEDVEMERDRMASYMCRECLRTHNIESVWCSVRCADFNFQRHREQTHLPERRRRGVNEPDGEELLWENEFRQKYHAKQIRKHLLSVPDVLCDWAHDKNIEAITDVYGVSLQ